MHETQGTCVLTALYFIDKNTFSLQAKNKIRRISSCVRLFQHKFLHWPVVMLVFLKLDTVVSQQHVLRQ